MIHHEKSHRERNLSSQQRVLEIIVFTLDQGLRVAPFTKVKRHESHPSGSPWMHFGVWLRVMSLARVTWLCWG